MLQKLLERPVKSEDVACGEESELEEKESEHGDAEESEQDKEERPPRTRLASMRA